MDRVLERLNYLISDRKDEYESSLQQWYKESRYYKEPTLKELFGESIGNDISKFKTALEQGDDISCFVSYFDDEAKNYGKSWYDEDLNCIRPGYEFEAKVCFNLRNIAAQAIGVPEARWENYYEGYGRA
ncbi:hypothetical protein SAMN05216349_1602 [Oribacterium sp. KHPX15]|uniref:hypothetical protein n=1 Tax=Oribacterium sp. KHPX15 TaxID=1855342 RepID=UPI0008952FB3|nr:hypothetical protein [Oribacterium sp. KHPX15]SEA93901.1 hypothetical protein SAMN05216349_1602 [Oribacterium sp. KHPX15]